MTDIPINRGKFGQTQKGRCNMKTNTERGDESMNQATPRIAKNCEKLRERHGRDYPSEPMKMN